MAKPRVTIIGLGRIGGSIGLAIKKASKASAEVEVVGHDKDTRVAQQAQKLDAVDKTDWNLINACAGAGLIVLALPLGAIRETLDVLSRELPAGVIVTDTASSKAPVVEWAAALPAGVSFVGGDPILPPQAGSRAGASGLAAARADLFQGATYCLTPTPTVEPDAVQMMTGFVALLGAKPLFLDAAEHDGLVAGAQHLAYLLSAALLQVTTTSSAWRELSRFAGHDFHDATELAARDPVAQREILLSHRADLTRWIDASVETLKELRAALARGDAAALDTLLSRMVQSREQWLAGQVRTEPAVVLADVQVGPFERMFLGGLALRGGRERKK